MYYAQIDTEGFCIGVSELCDKVDQDNMIQIQSYDITYMGRKYDREVQMWTNEVVTPEDVDKNSRLEQIEQALGDLSLEVAKISLLGGN